MNIGARVSATDRDGDTLTYPLGGTDAASFAVVGPTGQLADQRCAGLGNQVQPHRDRNRDRSGRRRRHHRGDGRGDQRGREGDGDPVGDAPQVRRGGNLHPSRPGQRRHGHNLAGGPSPAPQTGPAQTSTGQRRRAARRWRMTGQYLRVTRRTPPARAPARRPTRWRPTR